MYRLSTKDLLVIKLYHTASHFTADPNQIVLPARPLARIETDDPEVVFHLTQHGVATDRPWFANPDPRLLVLIRSTSVGDVLERADGARLIVAPTGFRPYPTDSPTDPLAQLAHVRALLQTVQTHHPPQSRHGAQQLQAARELLQEAMQRLQQARDSAALY